MSLEINRPRKKKSHISLTSINDSFQNEINIYNQANLHRESAVKRTYLINKSNSELAVIFRLEGELRGSVICTVDLFNKNIESDEIIYFQSLFVESMNILLGSFLTNLEESSGIMGMISNPRLFGTKDSIPGEVTDHLSESENCNVIYELNTLKDSFLCNISIIAQINKVIEV